MFASAPPQVVDNARNQFHILIETVSDPNWWINKAAAIGLILGVLLAAVIIARLLQKVINEVRDARKLPDSVVLPIRRFVRYVVYLIALLLVLQWFGVPMHSIWAALSAVAALVAIGFVAVWSVLSNISCSVMLMIFKPFRIGDRIELVENAAGPNVVGQVVDLTMMYVVIREETDDPARDGSTIQIPNNLFFQKTIRRTESKTGVNLEDHIEKHGLVGFSEDAKA
ncbi:MAG: mechanosensitive ion channel family protein [Planctomycetota bacterium]